MPASKAKPTKLEFQNEDLGIKDFKNEFASYNQNLVQNEQRDLAQIFGLDHLMGKEYTYKGQESDYVKGEADRGHKFL